MLFVTRALASGIAVLSLWIFNNKASTGAVQTINAQAWYGAAAALSKSDVYCRCHIPILHLLGLRPPQLITALKVSPYNTLE